MTSAQKDALYDFLENATDSFTINDVVSFIRLVDSEGTRRLPFEVASFINARNLAFHIDKKHLISRRGCFEPIRFVINPSRTEIMNGILIPGHRCIPFANPYLLPHEYSFYWQGERIPFDITEGPLEELCAYYDLFGEEFAPQCIAKDNPENELAFTSDPYEDPPEVSIHTLDMRGIYRKTRFVPGDVFSVKTLDWRNGFFELERVPKDTWSQTELYDWFEAAESGFRDAFALKGPCSSMEEQIAYAYWYGGRRMRELPAHALDDFLYNLTDQIETVPYGIESRFWYAGKEIPDNVYQYSDHMPPDRTVIEEVLFRHGIPVSEYVIQSYIRDALFRQEKDAGNIMARLVPPIIEADLNRDEYKYILRYIEDVYAEFRDSYSAFTDAAIGPTRQRAGELQSAVVELIAQLRRTNVDSSWFPKHTFVILSQIQEIAANAVEDLNMDDPDAAVEIEDSLDSMIETYENMRTLIDEGTEAYRRYNISIVKPDEETDEKLKNGICVQASLSGTDIWRRCIVPGDYSLDEIHGIIQVLFGWSARYQNRFISENRSSPFVPGEALDRRLTLYDLYSQGLMELLYEYGSQWMIRLLLLSPQDEEITSEVKCITAEGAAPPETLGGPLRFRRFLSILRQKEGPEQNLARRELGAAFDPGFFDLDACNKLLKEISRQKEKG